MQLVMQLVMQMVMKLVVQMVMQMVKGFIFLSNSFFKNTNYSILFFFWEIKLNIHYLTTSSKK